MKTRYFELLAGILSIVVAAGAQESRVVSSLVTTFVSTIPSPNGYFGSAVAAVGTDKILVGDYSDTGALDAGAAFLFSTNGALMSVLLNPTPGIYDNFGIAVAGVGPDRLVVGASGDDTGAIDAGSAYLFGTNGVLLATFANPTPAIGEFFGCAVAGVGTDHVLIGAYGDNASGTNAGAAYLFKTDGTLVTVFTGSTPVAFDFFGFTVAAVGTSHVLVGAFGDDHGAFGAGAAYLFSTNGTLVTSFLNPTPAGSDQFGSAVACVGTDRVLIGAFGDDTGALDAGAVYLFSTNGALLTTFTNPAPANADHFGTSVAGVGTDKVIIGADADDSPYPDSGSAYLFSVDGVILSTFSNPTPGFKDFFGSAVTSIGSEKVLIGAYLDNGRFYGDSGSAYLFTVTDIRIPPLNIEKSADGKVRMFWQVSGVGTVLEQTDGLASVMTNAWRPVAFPYETNASHISVTVTPTENTFYRLRKL